MSPKVVRGAALGSATVLMLLAASTTDAVAAGSATVQFQPQAQLQSDGMVLVGLTYSCSPSGSATSGNVVVLAFQPGAIGFGSTIATCDGASHRATLFLGPGPFTAGSATGLAFAGNLASHATTSAQLAVA